MPPPGAQVARGESWDSYVSFRCDVPSAPLRVRRQRWQEGYHTHNNTSRPPSSHSAPLVPLNHFALKLSWPTRGAFHGAPIPRAELWSSLLQGPTLVGMLRPGNAFYSEDSVFAFESPPSRPFNVSSALTLAWCNHPCLHALIMAAAPSLFNPYHMVAWWINMWMTDARESYWKGPNSFTDHHQLICSTRCEDLTEKQRPA